MDKQSAVQVSNSTAPRLRLPTLSPQACRNGAITCVAVAALTASAMIGIALFGMHVDLNFAAQILCASSPLDAIGLGAILFVAARRFSAQKAKTEILQEPCRHPQELLDTRQVETLLPQTSSLEDYLSILSTMKSPSVQSPITVEVPGFLDSYLTGAELGPRPGKPLELATLGYRGKISRVFERDATGITYLVQDLDRSGYRQLDFRHLKSQENLIDQFIEHVGEDYLAGSQEEVRTLMKVATQRPIMGMLRFALFKRYNHQGLGIRADGNTDVLGEKGVSFEHGIKEITDPEDDRLCTIWKIRKEGGVFVAEGVYQTALFATGSDGTRKVLAWLRASITVNMSTGHAALRVDPPRHTPLADPDLKQSSVVGVDAPIIQPPQAAEFDLATFNGDISNPNSMEDYRSKLHALPSTLSPRWRFYDDYLSQGTLSPSEAPIPVTAPGYTGEIPKQFEDDLPRETYLIEGANAHDGRYTLLGHRPEGFAKRADAFIAQLKKLEASREEILKVMRIANQGGLKAPNFAIMGRYGKMDMPILPTGDTTLAAHGIKFAPGVSPANRDDDEFCVIWKIRRGPNGLVLEGITQQPIADFASGAPTILGYVRATIVIDLARDVARVRLDKPTKRAILDADLARVIRPDSR